VLKFSNPILEYPKIILLGTEGEDPILGILHLFLKPILLLMVGLIINIIILQEHEVLILLHGLNLRLPGYKLRQLIGIKRILFTHIIKDDPTLLRHVVVCRDGLVAALWVFIFGLRLFV